MARRSQKSATYPYSPAGSRRAWGAKGLVQGALLLAGLLAAGAGWAQNPSAQPPTTPVFGQPSVAPGEQPGVALDPGGAAPPLTSPQVSALSAILIDAETGAVLWEKDAHTQRPNASTTKIMTATLMIESGRLTDTVKFSDRARRTDYANLNAKPGEQFKMSELLYAILLRSSNDSCVAVGEHLAGSPWKYAFEMTQKAHAIGAKDTNFVTTNGLYHPRHFSTAYDLAVMARYAFQYPEFTEAVRTQKHYIERSINQQDRLLKNHNKFLEKYIGADGVKTGYVRQSGKCLVASATSLEAGNPWRLIAVVLKSQDTYGDCGKLIDWGRTNFQPVFMSKTGSDVGEMAVRDGLKDRVPLRVSRNLVAITRRGANPRVETILHANGNLEAPVSAGTPAGFLTATVDGREAAQVPVETSQSVERVSASHAAVWTGWTLVLALVVLGPKYARAFAKGSRRSRRSVSARRRSVDSGGESYR